MNSKKPLLILFPYAGGNALSYRGMLEPLQTVYEVVTPELPGRETLSNKPLIDDINTLVDYLFMNVIEPLELDRQYIFYGHSMGALLAYLLANKIKQENLPHPTHLIVSGRNAPCFRRSKFIHHLPSTEFWDSLKTMGGVPDEFLEYQELKDYFEPIIKNDFKLVENYNYTIAKYSLDMPMTVIYGDQEEMTQESVYAWQQENKQPINFIEMQGNHFFIFDHMPVITDYLTSIVK